MNLYDGITHVSLGYAQNVQIPSTLLNHTHTSIIIWINEWHHSQLRHLCHSTRCGLVKRSERSHYLLTLLSSDVRLWRKQLHFHANNCIVLNKNNFVLSYFAWRIGNGFSEELLNLFLPLQHTNTRLGIL